MEISSKRAYKSTLIVFHVFAQTALMIVSLHSERRNSLCFRYLTFFTVCPFNLKIISIHEIDGIDQRRMVVTKGPSTGYNDGPWFVLTHTHTHSVTTIRL